jgi:RsiW-degrading membrane proteinase PrsW (M82 family)
MITILTTTLLLTVAIGPALFWLIFFYRKDKYATQPLSWIVKIFLLGALITIPIAICESIAGIVLSEFALFVIVAPVMEECGKYFVVTRYVYTTSEFNEPVDGIMYAVAAALGFATIENILYIFSIPLTELPTLFSVVFVRAVLSVPGHALFSSIWGYSLGIAKFGLPRDAPKILTGLAVAIVFHALFNFLLMNILGIALLLLIVIPYLWRLARRNIGDALKKSRCPVKINSVMR